MGDAVRKPLSPFINLTPATAAASSNPHTKRPPMKYLMTLSAACIALAATNTSAQTAGSAPSTQPLRIIVPYAAGGTSDILARLIAPQLSARLNKPVIVE